MISTNRAVQVRPWTRWQDWALAMPALMIPEWINLLLGAWLFISLWVLGYSLSRTAWFAWVIGALVALIYIWVIAMGRTRNTGLTA
jgi:SPW repeat